MDVRRNRAVATWNYRRIKIIDRVAFVERVRTNEAGAARTRFTDSNAKPRFVVRIDRSDPTKGHRSNTAKTVLLLTVSKICIRRMKV